MAKDVRVVNLLPYTPAEAIELVSRAGMKKGQMRADKVFLSAVSAGCLSSFASASYLSVTTAPWFQANAPGLIEMAGSLIFPYGLVLVVLTGADLCTGSFMYTTVAVLHGRLSLWRMILHWVLCFFGNLAGALFVVAVLCGYGDVFGQEPYRAHTIEVVKGKQLDPTFTQILLRGIGCNWLVTLAVYLSLQGRDIWSKILGLWWPIFGFVSLGFDNLVANMFFIPMGLWIGTPDLTIELYIWKGIVPVLIGNIIGGSIFVGGYYWWTHIALENDIAIDGSILGVTASEQASNSARNKTLDVGAPGIGKQSEKSDFDRLAVDLGASWADFDIRKTTDNAYFKKV